MTLRNKPTEVNKIWASDGDIDSPSSEKIENGWLAEEKPPNQYFNWLENKQDLMLAHINQFGIPKWDEYTEYKAGLSYCQGASGNIYRAKSDNTTTNPDADVSETTWKKVLDKDGAVSLVDISTFMKTLFPAADGDELLDLILATPVGKSLVFAGDQAAARAAIGADLYLARANHTGTQAISTITDLSTELSAKEAAVNKVTDLTSPNNTTYPTTQAVATALSAATAGEEYQGEWDADTNTPTLVDSTGTQGHWYRVVVAGTTEIDGIDVWSVGDDIIFSDGVWLRRPGVVVDLDTDDITEASNLYFTEGRVRSSVLTGLSTASSSNIDATDSILVALGKLQAQITAMSGRLLPSGGSTGQVLAKSSGTNYAVQWNASSNSLYYPVNNIGTGTKTLDCSSHNYWNITSNGTATITNLPGGSTVFTGYVRFVGTSLSFTSSGKTFSWVGGVTPTLNGSKYNLIMFTNVLGGSKINLMLVDQGDL